MIECYAMLSGEEPQHTDLSTVILLAVGRVIPLAVQRPELLAVERPAPLAVERQSYFSA